MSDEGDACLWVLPVLGIPEVGRGDRLGGLIAERAGIEPGDAVVISQKVVSKAEGRTVRLADVQPSGRASELAAQLGKDPSLVQLILAESTEVLRAERGRADLRDAAGIRLRERRRRYLERRRGRGFAAAARRRRLGAADPRRASRCDRDRPRGAGLRQLRARLAPRAGRGRDRLRGADPDRRLARPRRRAAEGCWRRRRSRSPTRSPRPRTWFATRRAGIPVAIVRGLGDLVTEDDGPGAAALRRPRDQDLFR